MSEQRKNIFHISEWITNYFLGSLSEEEKENLRLWLEESESNRRLLDSLCEEIIDRKRLEMYATKVPERAFQVFLRRRRQLEIKRRFIGWSKYAAILILFLGIGIYFRWNGQPVYEKQMITGTIEKSYKHKPVVTLGNGQEIILEDTSLVLSSNQGIAVARQDSCRLIYATGSQATHVLEYHTLRTPAQCDYCFILSDGTKVWVNAKTTVKYPVVFSENERSIQVSGEVYLEVAKDMERPFYVETGELRVKVLGTSFNVNTYEDQGYSAITLVEGKVDAEIGNKVYPLRPAQQLCLDRRTGHTTLTEVNVEDITAWRKGIYVFRSQTLEEVCRVLQRWYDVEVVFENPHYLETIYTGIVFKEEKVEDFVHNLNASSGYHCQFENGIIYIR